MASHTPPPASEQIFDSESFAAELFWQRHRTTILVGVAIVLIAIIAIVTWLITSHNTRLAAEAAFAKADTPEAWSEIVKKYPGTAPAADAYFLLAQSLREQGKLAESTATYEKFLSAFPTHQLAGGARLGLAENLTLAGKTDDALTALRNVQSKDGGTYAAPFAALLEGRIYLRQGRLDEARKIFSSLVATYSQSLAARVAGSQLDAIAPILPAEQKKAAAQ